MKRTTEIIQMLFAMSLIWWVGRWWLYRCFRKSDMGWKRFEAVATHLMLKFSAVPIGVLIVIGSCYSCSLALDSNATFNDFADIVLLFVFPFIAISFFLSLRASALNSYVYYLYNSQKSLNQDEKDWLSKQAQRFQVVHRIQNIFRNPKFSSALNTLCENKQSAQQKAGQNASRPTS